MASEPTLRGQFRSRRPGVSSWVTNAEVVLETLGHSPLNHVTRLLVRKFSRRESFRLCNTKSRVLRMPVVCLPLRCMTNWLRCIEVGEFRAYVLRHNIISEVP
jgi:hypothetical protein